MKFKVTPVLHLKSAVSFEIRLYLSFISKVIEFKNMFLSNVAHLKVLPRHIFSILEVEEIETFF